MDGENVPHDPQQGIKPMFNNPKLSDVRFLVEGQTVYGHKFVLALASPVFESMFYGELKEKREVIEIKDLTLVGFKNALRYIYGLPIDYELCDLYESYMAGDKYLLNHFGKAFFDFVKSKLDAKSSCLIYDQLIKIGEREEIRLDELRSVIIKNSQETIGSEHFTKIDQETLISLLSLNQLDIDEADLLAAVSKWVDCEVQRQGLPVNRENRRRVFQPIKHYVLFTALTSEKVVKCKIIADLLTLEEAGSLVFHLNQGEPFVIELKTSRSARSGGCVVFASDLFSRVLGYDHSSSVYLTVSRRVRIRTVYLTYSQSVTNLSFYVQNNSSRVYLDLKTERSVNDGKVCLSLCPSWDVQANQKYRLFVYCDALNIADKITNEQTLLYKSIVFDLKPYDDYNFVRGFEFVPLD